MKRRLRLAGFGLSLMFLVAGCDDAPSLPPAHSGPTTAPTTAPTTSPAAAASGYRYSGPYTHDNLTVYLIHGADQPKAKTYLTLQEAMDQKKVIVHETKQVNELAIENVSDDEVYIQSGDIVKGGQQDRTLTNDLIVSAHSGKIPLDAHCVEHGRWSGRGGESSALFSSSGNMLSSKSQKMGNYSKSQAGVWTAVAEQQVALHDSIMLPTDDDASPSSLQLTLENGNVQKASEAYVKLLKPIIDDKSDVIGFAFAINGKVNSADVYASHALFGKLWPKLINAAAVEAATDLKKDLKYEPATEKSVRDALASADNAKSATTQPSDRVSLNKRESEKSVMYETQDRKVQDASGGYVHRCYLTKDQPTTQPTQDQQILLPAAD